ncbi:MAG: DUF4097 domain-containing protein [Chloroflexota bacterium]
MKPELTEQKFKVSKEAVLNVENIRGLIQITRGDDKEISISAKKHLDSGDVENTQVSIEQEKSGAVKVRTIYKNRKVILMGLGNGKPAKVEYEIKVPKHASIEANNVSGDLTVEVIDGIFDLNTVSGKIIASKLNDQIKLNTVSGKIEGDALRGEADVNTVSGTVYMKKCDFPRLDLNSVSGKMVVETPIGDGPYDLNTVSGNVKLIVEDGTAASVHATSISGRFKTSLNTTAYSRSHADSRADINGGGTKILMNSISGDLYLVTSEDDVAVTPANSNINRAKSNQPSSEERLGILSEIHEGTLSIDDALVKLG